MMKNIYRILFVLILVLTACEKNEGEKNKVIDGIPSDLFIKVKPICNSVVTRATSSEYDESKINNLYVFVCDGDGSVVSRKYFSYEDILSFTIDDIIYLPSINVSSGENREIALIANVDFDIMDITHDALDNVESNADLHNMISSIVQNSVERGSSFLMSGFLSDVTIEHGGSTSVIVPMTRVDAKVTFNVATKEGVEFYPTNWSVVNLPKHVELFKSDSDDNTDILKQKSEDMYFNSRVMNFEGTGDMRGKTFSFYMLEHKIIPNNKIPESINGTTLTDNERYALREKQEKIPVGVSNLVTNGAFIYAPKYATYVKIKGRVYYNETDELGNIVRVSAEVIYYVHLGNTNRDVNDYTVLRNTHYIYNITINSVNDIIVEVDSRDNEEDKEPRPGAEGNVIRSQHEYEIDAYFGTSVIAFDAADINSNISWYVRTPFCEGPGNISNSPEDIKWVYFKLNRKGENGNYITTYATYPGSSSKYADDKDFTAEEDYLQYIQDYNNGTDKLVNVRQLVDILRHAKEHNVSGDELNLFDTNNKFTVTAFVNEFYYDYNPLNEEIPLTEIEKRNYWKRFVNSNKRLMNILSETYYSKDGMSCKSVAFYSLKQSSIETIYNVDDTDDFTAWGTQTIQDDNLYLYDPYTNLYPKWNSDGNNSSNNGRKNSLRIIKELRLEIKGDDNADLRWDEIIDTDTWTIKDEYNYAKYIWIAHNRDINGNGIIDDNEIKWYLAAETQLADLWIGMDSYDAGARLYQYDDWSDYSQKRQYYCSSTMSTRNSGGRDIIKIMWSSEGASMSDSDPSWLKGVDGNGVDAKVHYRSLRNLGIEDDDFNTIPDDISEVSVVERDGKKYPTIKLKRLNSKSIRNYSQKHELVEHGERDAANKPYSAFEAYYENIGHSHKWYSYREQIANGGTFCPDGYRLPNQRELILMIAKMQTEINDNGGWPQYTACRTSFSFFSETNGRVGFTTNRDGSGLHILLINKKGEGTPNAQDHSFTARCIRDLPE